jgi:hypothetical protein
MDSIPSRVSPTNRSSSRELDSNAELYRKEVIALGQEVDYLKKEINVLEAAKYKAYIRISELLQEISDLNSASEQE